MTGTAYLAAAAAGLVVAAAVVFVVLLLAEDDATITNRPLTLRFVMVASGLAMVAVAVASTLPTVVLG